MPADPNGPHSRACGVRMHEHGRQCHSNCPTCHGKAQPVAQYDMGDVDEADLVKVDVSLPEVKAPASLLELAEAWEKQESLSPLITHTYRLAAEELREVLRQQGDLLNQFVQWVASNRAYNGAPDPGQSLYNEQINAVLPTWALEFIEWKNAHKIEGQHERKAGDWPEGDDRLCTILSCYNNEPHSHGGTTIFEGHRRYTSRWFEA